MHPLLSFYMRTAAIAIGSIVLMVGVPIFLFLFLAKSFGEGMCSNSFLYDVPSPSGTLKATVFERSCGATTGFTTHVSILQAREQVPDEGGNVFLADTDRGRAPSGIGGGPAVQITWLADHKARIEHHPLARLFKTEQSYQGVTVEYSSTNQMANLAVQGTLRDRAAQRP